MHHPLHKSLKAAYSFYNVHTETPLMDLMNDALILAKLVGLWFSCHSTDLTSTVISDTIIKNSVMGIHKGLGTFRIAVVPLGEHLNV